MTVNSVGNFDVIIIGGGPAGISAALWCDELGLSAILLESKTELGGQLLRTYNAIENHLGSKAKNGVELRDIFVEQLRSRKFTLRLNANIVNIDLDKKTILLDSHEILTGKSLIIATGVRRRKLGIKGEDHFKGKGIIQSGKRDKNLVKGKRVLIVGGGDAALENCTILSDQASKIYLAHRRNKFRARIEFIEAAIQNPKVEILRDTVLKEISGDAKIKNVRIEDLNENKIYSLPIDIVLFRIGVEPNTNFLNNFIELDKKGYIKINNNCETNHERVFAIGDVANPVSPTISSSVGMGATAIKYIYKLLS